MAQWSGEWGPFVVPWGLPVVVTVEVQETGEAVVWLRAPESPLLRCWVSI